MVLFRLYPEDYTCLLLLLKAIEVGLVLIYSYVGGGGGCIYFSRIDSFASSLEILVFVVVLLY